MHSFPLVCGAMLLACAATTSCNENETNSIGSSLTQGEVTITVDSTAFDLDSRPIYRQRYDTRSTTTLLGRLDVPEYGSLSCSFVSQLLPAAALALPDSITESHVDSMKMIIQVPRGSLTGDSLSPQQLRVFRLNRQLPSDISNQFDPTGYYDPSSPIGTRSYTISAIAASDSLFTNATAIPISVSLPREEALATYRAYHKRPEIFQWPAEFAKFMPGIYVEQNFGRGCVANISKAFFLLYWHYRVQRNVIVDSVSTLKTVLMKDSVAVFTTAPEVLSSNNISYIPSQALDSHIAAGETILTTPGGYETRITFPAQAILNRYHEQDFNMAVINGLSVSLPATTVPNDYNIGVAPYLLMVKTAEADDFFAEGRIPDEKTSFYATYNSLKGSYEFTNMRQYLLDLVAKGKVDETDTDFTLMPVYLAIEVEKSPYSNVVTQYVTSCTPYIYAPTMTRLYTDRAMICFTFSQQIY